MHTCVGRIHPTCPEGCDVPSKDHMEGYSSTVVVTTELTYHERKYADML